MGRTYWRVLRVKGGPAPLYVNPAQASAGFLAIANGFLVILGIVGVVVNKLTDETCQENFLGLFVTLSAVALLTSGLFLHLSMTALASDTEWRGFLLAAAFMTVLEVPRGGPRR